MACHHTMLRRVVLGIVGDRSSVDDVLQDAYLKAYRRLPLRFDSVHQEAAWLYRIAYNAALDTLRKRARREKPGYASVDLVAGDSIRSDVYVRTALSELSEISRAVLLLVDLAGFDYEAAAAVLGIPRGTVASRLHTAREQFRRTIET